MKLTILFALLFLPLTCYANSLDGKIYDCTEKQVYLIANGRVLQVDLIFPKTLTIDIKNKKISNYVFEDEVKNINFSSQLRHIESMSPALDAYEITINYNDFFPSRLILYRKKNGLVFLIQFDEIIEPRYKHSQCLEK